MKKKALKLGTTNPISFKLLGISLSLVFIFIVSGCITPHALDLAERKSSPSITYTDWNIKKIRSAVEQENGDISVCVELYESHKSHKSKCYAITLPSYSLLKTADLTEHGFQGLDIAEQPDKYSLDPYIVNYFYPLAKAKKGCHKLESEKLPAGSTLPIVKFTLPERDPRHLYNLLSDLKEEGSPEEKLYEVTFLKKEEDSSVEMNENKTAKYSDVLLIYWPSERDQELVQPIGIAGGYESEDESTNLYYLLVPPAAMLDAIGIMMLAAAYRPM